jgi:hypothetical protein
VSSERWLPLHRYNQTVTLRGSAVITTNDSMVVDGGDDDDDDDDDYEDAEDLGEVEVISETESVVVELNPYPRIPKGTVAR